MDEHTSLQEMILLFTITKSLLKYLNRLGVKVSFIVVSDDYFNENRYEGISVKQFSDVMSATANGETIFLVFVVLIPKHQYDKNWKLQALQISCR